MAGITIKKYNVAPEFVAEVMSEHFSLCITPEMVTRLNQENPDIAVWAAQLGYITFLCWVDINGSFNFQHVTW